VRKAYRSLCCLIYLILILLHAIGARVNERLVVPVSAGHIIAVSKPSKRVSRRLIGVCDVCKKSRFRYHPKEIRGVMCVCVHLLSVQEDGVNPSDARTIYVPTLVYGLVSRYSWPDLTRASRNLECRISLQTRRSQ